MLVRTLLHAETSHNIEYHYKTAAHSMQTQSVEIFQTLSSIYSVAQKIKALKCFVSINTKNFEAKFLQQCHHRWLTHTLPVHSLILYGITPKYW